MRYVMATSPTGCGVVQHACRQAAAGLVLALLAAGHALAAPPATAPASPAQAPMFTVADNPPSWASGEINTALSRGLEAWHADDLPGAGRWFSLAQRLSEMAGDVPLTAYTLQMRGQLAAAQEDWYWAAKHWGAALNRYEMLRDMRLQGLAHRNLAGIALARDNPAAAVDEYRRAALCYKEHGDPWDRAAVLRDWARLAEAQNDAEEAARLRRLARHAEAQWSENVRHDRLVAALNQR